MGPVQNCQPTPPLQDVPRPGCRLCLLKGCEQPFQPAHPLSRYCSAACRDEARRWHRRMANLRYRDSEQGKCHRRAQACRYRERVRERQSCTNDCSSTAGEGYHHPIEPTDSFCHRPGCYETFTRTARSPQQKFCSAGCRQALRRVVVRERRWRRKLEAIPRVAWLADDSW